MTTYSQLNKQERQDYHERADRALENWGISLNDFTALAEIEHKLQRWAERECNGEVERDEETGKCWAVNPNTGNRWRTNDLETGAIKRAQEICNRNGGWFYHQGDPRGCQVYFWRSGEPSGSTIGPDEDISQHYSTRALACYF